MVDIRKFVNNHRPERKSALLLLPSNAALFLKGLYTGLARGLACQRRGFRAAAGFGLCFVLVSLVFVSATSCMSNGTSDGQALEVHLDNPITMTGGTLNSTTTVVNNTTTLIGNTTTQVQNTTTQYPTTTIQNTTTVQNTTTQYPTTTVQNTTTQYPTTTQVNNTTTQISNTTTQVATTTVGCLYGPAASIPAIGSVPDGQMYIDTDDGHWWQAQLVTSTGSVEDQNTSNNSDVEGATDTYWFAQTFTASSSYSCGSIQIYTGSQFTNSSSCTIYLETTASNLPSGTILASATLNLAYSTSWQSVTFTPVSLTSSTVYAIVVKGIAGNYTALIDNWGGNPYSSGQECQSTDSGSSWSANSSADLCFKVLSTGSTAETWVQIK